MTLRLFEGWGIELEYMIVDARTLAVRPICDELLRSFAGEYANEVSFGDIACSNELALHVVELKTNGPVAELTGVPAAMADALAQLQGWLSGQGAMLLPTAMHPTMNPAEGRLWPHDGKPIYSTYDRVFGTRGHGWVNLQSMHINLPFCGDDEFGTLHAAIRAVLPILPALAASSPVIEGRATGVLDNRLQVYFENQKRIASVMGRVVPEPVWTRSDYEREILAPMYRDIAPFDPEGELQDEWLNSRGAIARFQRNAIEIRVIDLQEHPTADLAIAHLCGELVRALCTERWISLADLKALETDALAGVLRRVVGPADAALIDDVKLLRALGRTQTRMSARDLWAELAAELWDATTPTGFRAALKTIFERGCLARRILAELGTDFDRAAVEGVYRQLSDCLRDGRSFGA